MKMSYSHDFEIIESDWLARNMPDTYDFETHKNLSHKQSVLFYGHSRISSVWARNSQNFSNDVHQKSIFEAFLKGLENGHFDGLQLHGLWKPATKDFGIAPKRPGTFIFEAAVSCHQASYRCSIRSKHATEQELIHQEENWRKEIRRGFTKWYRSRYKRIVRKYRRIARIGYFIKTLIRLLWKNSKRGTVNERVLRENGIYFCPARHISSHNGISYAAYDMPHMPFEISIIR